MLKTQITGAKYLSPQTNQMTNLNIAVPADSKDTEFGTSDILLAKDTVKLIEDKTKDKLSYKIVDQLPKKESDIKHNVIYLVRANADDEMGSRIGGLIKKNDTYREYIYTGMNGKDPTYECLGYIDPSKISPINQDGTWSAVMARSEANASFASAFGFATNATVDYQTVVGSFNIPDTLTSGTDEKKNNVFVIGNGDSFNSQHNAMEVRWNGDVYIQNQTTTDTTNPSKNLTRLQDSINKIQTLYNEIENLKVRINNLESKETI